MVDFGLHLETVIHGSSTSEINENRLIVNECAAH